MKCNAEKKKEDFSDKLNQHFLSLGTYTYLRTLMSFVVLGKHYSFCKFETFSQLWRVQYLLLKHNMTLWLIKYNILRDDTTSMAIQKASLIKKFTVTMHLQNISWELCAVHDGSPKSNYFNNLQKSENWNTVKTTGAKVTSSKKCYMPFCTVEKFLNNSSSLIQFHSIQIRRH